MNKKYDIIIVGAGAVGVASAYQLQQKNPKLSIAVIEKEKEVAAHQTGHNSGVIHSGVYYKPGSHRATNCFAGYHKLLAFCEEYQVPYDLCGKIILATEDSELDGLQAIYDKGTKNGLQGLAFLDEKELQKIEPHARGIRAIHVPSAGIISYKAVVQKLQSILSDRGVDFYFNTKVLDFECFEASTNIQTTKGLFSSGLTINCAGLYSDKLAQATGFDDLDYQIIPFRGEYYKLKPTKTHLVKGLIYPVPDPSFPFLGVHFTKMIHGGVEAGPNAVLAFKREGYRKSQIDLGELSEILGYKGFRILAKKYWRKGATEMNRSFFKSAFVRSLQKLIPSISANDIVKGGSGVRAMALKVNGEMLDDFLILKRGNIINVCNAPSPAATASLEIGYQIACLAI